MSVFLIYFLVLISPPAKVTDMTNNTPSPRCMLALVISPMLIPLLISLFA